MMEQSSSAHEHHGYGFVVRRIIIRLMPLIILMWLVGLATFATMIPRNPAVPAQRYDAMIVLTGGAKRIPAALELMRQHKADTLFISGVGNDFRVEDVDDVIPPELRKRVIYGMEAQSTVGNARETRDWLRSHPEYRRILIVTANYHMPRTQLLFHHYLAGYECDYFTVDPALFTLEKWPTHPNSLYLVLSEYNKWLVTLLHVYAGYDGL
ncbi:MAG: YdcF family protein [Alphaproteobacteria bacterium]|nr:MAG: YdcF family protein [Alphaproteobacteria bacterium]